MKFIIIFFNSGSSVCTLYKSAGPSLYFSDSCRRFHTIHLCFKHSNYRIMFLIISVYYLFSCLFLLLFLLVLLILPCFFLFPVIFEVWSVCLPFKIICGTSLMPEVKTNSDRKDLCLHLPDSGEYYNLR